TENRRLVRNDPSAIEQWAVVHPPYLRHIGRKRHRRRSGGIHGAEWHEFTCCDRWISRWWGIHLAAQPTIHVDQQCTQCPALLCEIHVLAELLADDVLGGGKRAAGMRSTGEKVQT